MQLDEETLTILAKLGDRYPGSVAEIMRVLRQWDRDNRPWVMPQSSPIELQGDIHAAVDR